MHLGNNDPFIYLFICIFIYYVIYCPNWSIFQAYVIQVYDIHRISYLTKEIAYIFIELPNLCFSAYFSLYTLRSLSEMPFLSISGFAINKQMLFKHVTYEQISNPCRKFIMDDVD